MTAPGCPPLTNFDRPWFGRPGAMEKLPMPDGGISRPAVRGIVAHTVMSGGNTPTRRRDLKRAYALAYSDRLPAAQDVLRSYWSGVMGKGPYCLVDPAEVNHLDEDASTMGARGLGHNWMLTGVAPGTAVTDAAVAPPAACSRSDVLRWSGAFGGNAFITANANRVATVPGGAAISNFEVDPLRAPVHLPGVPYVFSFYASVATGTFANLYAYLTFRNGDGTVNHYYVAGPLTLTTAWQQFSVSTASTPSGTIPATDKYVVPSLYLGGANVALADVLLAGAALNYGSVAPRPWLIGQHIPRVSFGEGDGGSARVYWRRSHAYSLVEN